MFSPYGSLLCDGSGEAAFLGLLPRFPRVGITCLRFFRKAHPPREIGLRLNLEKLREAAFLPHYSRLEFLRTNEGSLEEQYPTYAGQQAQQEPNIEGDESARSSASTAQNTFSLRREE